MRWALRDLVGIMLWMLVFIGSCPKMQVHELFTDNMDRQLFNKNEYRRDLLTIIIVVNIIIIIIDIGIIIRKNDDGASTDRPRSD